MKLFSIITVCFNAEDHIGKTIQSVLEQDCTDYEYIIKDGNSSDRTLEIARSFSAEFEKRGVSYRIVSGRDRGVYDAMNLATAVSNGMWLNFMNAGDWFFDSTVLGRIRNCLAGNNADILYGDAYYRDRSWFRFRKTLPLDTIYLGQPFLHQSAFIKRSLLLSAPYDLRYAICADHHFFIRMYQEKKMFAYYPYPIAIYENNGISSNTAALHREILKLLKELAPWNEEAILARLHAIKALQSPISNGNLVRQYKKLPMGIRRFTDFTLKPVTGWITEKEFREIQKSYAQKT